MEHDEDLNLQRREEENSPGGELTVEDVVVDGDEGCGC